MDYPRVHPDDSAFQQYTWQYNASNVLPPIPSHMIAPIYRGAAGRLPAFGVIPPQLPPPPPEGQPGLRTLEEWSQMARSHIMESLRHRPNMTKEQFHRLMSLKDFNPSAHYTPTSTTLHVTLPDRTVEPVPVPTGTSEAIANERIEAAYQEVEQRLGGPATENVLVHTKKVLKYYNRDMMRDPIQEKVIMTHFMDRITLEGDPHEPDLPMPVSPPRSGSSSSSDSESESVDYSTRPNLPQPLDPGQPQARTKDLQLLLQAVLTESGTDAQSYAEAAANNAILRNLKVKDVFKPLHDWLAKHSFHERARTVFSLRGPLACISCGYSLSLTTTSLAHPRCLSFFFLASFSDTIVCDDGLHHHPSYNRPLSYRLCSGLRNSHPLRLAFSSEGKFVPVTRDSDFSDVSDSPEHPGPPVPVEAWEEAPD